MSFNFSFHPAESTRDLKNGIDFLASQDLDYPGYRDVWIPKAEAELFSGVKTMILAEYYSQIIGDIIFQKHKRHSRIREIKNLRVHDDFSGRFIASFLLRQTESEKREEFDALIGDVRESEQETLKFMLRNGYKQIAALSLYEKDKREILIAKSLSLDYDLSRLS